MRDHLKNVVAPTQVEIPQSIFDRAQSAIKTLYQFAHSPTWIQELRERLSDSRLVEVLETPAPDTSVLMSYDFHYDFQSGQLSLIEINTNASLFTVAAELYDDSPKFFENPLQQLKNSFMQEWQTLPRIVAIVDENLRDQKTYFEFQIYADLFRSWGVEHAELVDVKAIQPEKYDFIYNRFTDFYLTETVSQALWHFWQKKPRSISPHPREYLLLADKQRLIDFSEKRLSDVLIPTRHVRSFASPEELWEQRKSYFFKPRNAFGGKAVYRGSSITSKIFNEISNRDYIAQEYRPAGEWQGKKFDLRFYVYKSDIQLACARVYTGQVTNFTNPGGGVAAVIFK